MKKKTFLKRLFTLFCTLAFVFPVAACGESLDDDFETSLYKANSGYIDGFYFNSYNEFSEFYSDFKKYNKITTISADLDEFSKDNEYKLAYSFYCYPFIQEDGMPTWKGRFSSGQFLLRCSYHSKDSGFSITCRNLLFKNYAVDKNKLIFERKYPNYYEGDEAYYYSIYHDGVEIAEIVISMVIKNDDSAGDLFQTKNDDFAEELFQTLKQNLVVLK